MARILYVEDNFDNYKLIEFILSKNGFSVMNAVDGLDAIEKAETYKPDLILMDINLPNLKGFEAATLIKSKPETKDIPIVVLTAAYSNEYRYLADKVGCVGYFTKPIDPLTFAEDIKKILENKHEKGFDDPLAVELSKSLEEKAKKVVYFGKELSRMERKFNSIIEAIMDPIILVDEKSFVIYINDAGNKYHFLKSLYKNPIDFTLFFEDVDHFYKNIERIGYLKNHIFKVDDLIFIGNFVKIDKEFLITLKDITEIHAMIEKQKEIDKFAVIGRIASGVVHELNNPIAALKTYIDIYPKKFLGSDNQEKVLNEFTSKLKSSLERVINLVENLALFSRKSQEPKIKLNLNLLIKELLSFSSYDLKRGGVSIELNLSEDLPLVKGCKAEIEQAILNLLINANDALQGKEDPRITISTYSDGSSVYLEVEDNGYGIPNDVQKNMFEPFFTTKGDKGTGLGLPIVLNIVNKHEGVLKFFTSNNGTKFVLSFPRLIDTEADGKS